MLNPPHFKALQDQSRQAPAADGLNSSGKVTPRRILHDDVEELTLLFADSRNWEEVV